VPLFVEEVTKSLLESGDLVEEADRYVYGGLAAGLAVPATLRDSLMARLDRVTAVKEIAQIGATIGREFSYGLLSAVSPMPRSALDEGLERLIDSGLAFRRGRIPDATFTFKHALVQDAAYDSLLKSRRQVLHAAIAEVLGERYPGTAESAPELLARHYTAAGMDEQAVGFWQRAAESALRRVTFPEAIAHLRAGLACADRLPAGPARDLAELTLRTQLGPALLAHRGWAHSEVSQALEPAWELATSLAHTESYLPVLHGLWVHHMSGCRLTTSIQWAERMLDSAVRADDEGLEIAGRRAAMTSYFWKGDLLRARENGDVVVAKYDPARHGQIAQRTHSDPLTGDGIYRAHYLWMLGYPDQARAVHDTTLDHARRRSHPFDVAFTLTLGAQVFDYRGEAQPLLQHAAEAERVGREFGVPLMSEIMAEISKGEGWLLEGRFGDSVEQLREAIQRLNGTGHRVWVAYLNARLGEALARSGDVAGGLALVEASLAREECREDRVHLAEMLRLQGWMLMELGRPVDAERALRAALDVAREQHARSWELRAGTTLARLLEQRGDVAAARALLTPIHGWFTEGFDTRDLQDATRLLERLAE
jgi:tetratricopeptide (TPR) repeat protein